MTSSSRAEDIQTRLDDLREQIAEVSQPLDEANARVAAAAAGSSEQAELEEQRQGVLAQVLPQLAPLQSRESSLRGTARAARGDTRPVPGRWG